MESTPTAHLLFLDRQVVWQECPSCGVKHLAGSMVYECDSKRCPNIMKYMYSHCSTLYNGLSQGDSQRLEVMYFEKVNRLPRKLSSTLLQISELSEFARLHDTCQNKTSPPS
jgi:hypothetical protein